MAKKTVDRNEIDEAMILSLVDTATDYNLIPRNKASTQSAVRTGGTNSAEAEIYRSIFLQKNRIDQRTTVHMSRPLMEKLRLILQRIGNGQVSLTGLIDNIVREHLEKHKDAINELCKNNSDIL